MCSKLSREGYIYMYVRKIITNIRFVNIWLGNCLTECCKNSKQTIKKSTDICTQKKFDSYIIN